MSTEHMNSGLPSPQDKEWESTMLSFVERNEGNGAPIPTRKKLPFRRRTFTVILSAVGTVLLAIILLVVTLCVKPTSQGTDETPTTSDEETSTPAISLLDKTGTNKTQLKQIDIKNADETFSVLYDDTAKTYVIKGYEDLTISSEIIETLRAHTETIEALEQVNNVTSLSAFGLEAPQATADITYADGSTAYVRVGDMTPSETGFYGQFGESEDVYIFASDNVAMFRCRAAAYVDTQLVTSPTVKSSDENGVAVLRNVTFTGSAHPTPLVLRRSNHLDSEEFTYFSYIITTPYLRATNDSTSNNLGSFKSLSAEQALILHPTDEQKKKLGFNDPLIKINATMAVETEEETEDNSDDDIAPVIYYNVTDYTITIGSRNEDGNYVVMVDGIDAIFLVSKEEYSYVFDVTYQNAVNSYLFFKNIQEIGRITVRVEDQEHEFHLKHYPEKEDQDDQLVVTKEGTVYSTVEFRDLYGMMLQLERESATTIETGGESPLEITLYDTNDQLYLSAKYYDSTGSLCAVETSEGEVFATRWGYVSFFMEQVQNYLDGKDVLINT